MDAKTILKRKIPVLILICLILVAALLYSLTGCASLAVPSAGGEAAAVASTALAAGLSP